jgi:hypothetical protein
MSLNLFALLREQNVEPSKEPVIYRKISLPIHID